MNPEQRKQVIIAALLGVVLVGVLIFQFTRPSPNAGQPKTSTSQTAPKADKAGAAKSRKDGHEGSGVTFKKADVDIDALVASVRVPDFDYQGKRTSRDPMAPLVGEAMTKLPGQLPRDGKGPSIEDQILINAISDKEVSGIVYDPVNPRAVVDGEIVAIGAKFPLGIEVIDIGPEYVRFRGGNVDLPVGLKE